MQTSFISVVLKTVTGKRQNVLGRESIVYNSKRMELKRLTWTLRE